MPEDETRAVAFATLVLSIVVLILVNRSYSSSLRLAIARPNRTLAYVLATVAAMLALTMIWPVARDLFHFGRLALTDAVLIAGAGFGLWIVLETTKRLLAKRLVA
jgi:Ca2+-transporting ATPase